MADKNADIPVSAPPSTVLAASSDDRIYVVRGERVMLDSDLAEFYGVETKILNKAVARNRYRFPERFAFRLQAEEWENLRFQFGTSNASHGGRRYLPWVFTEHGAIMLASVLNSSRAVEASIVVIDAFVRYRRVLDTNRELARRIDELNARLDKKTGEDAVRFQAIFQELKRLALGYDADAAKTKGRIGFRTNKEREAEGGGQRGRAKGKA